MILCFLISNDVQNKNKVRPAKHSQLEKRNASRRVMEPGSQGILVLWGTVRWTISSAESLGLELVHEKMAEEQENRGCAKKKKMEDCAGVNFMKNSRQLKDYLETVL